ncbi:glycosyltransferase family 4 protein [Salinimonas chungwhensis]|uniref:glycosyltransferase family 4 protein n=1 Tax=Salinimonas chungwhensis TaxID=265425 RepID=UPI00036A6569|nr:glycosyltransferase family 4 protein [Salinimonas chungwhensis]
MKLCAVGLRGIPNVMGGIESHCQQLYPRMAEADIDITVICRSPYVDKHVRNYKGVRLRSVWTLKHKFFETFLHTFLAIIYARIVVRPDVLHIHAIGPALFAPLARLLGMKVVVTHHGADYDRQKWNSFAKTLLKLGETLGIKFANKIIVVGQSLTTRLQNEHPAQAAKICYVPNGALTDVDASLGADKLPGDLDIKPGGFILTVGRLVPEKGFHDLAEAYRKSQSELKLVIVGSADHEDDYSRALINQASENIMIAGRRSGDELHALYKFARVFCLPSYHEGLPIVALEAIAAGTQVILSDITPNADIGLPDDCYFEVGNTDALAEKLTELSALNLQIDKARFLETFNWDNIAVEAAQIIKSSAGSATGSARRANQ